jgi:hypothetical protein
MRWTAFWGGGGGEDPSRNIAEPFKFIILGSDTQDINLKYQF